ncbi:MULTISPECIES: TIR domain-containing protein [Psychrobacter]|uniref:TIR domain-containing protein n=1 Tax=Psychrobacter TaxID=497 RepID=UPI001D114249|nr:TIR domain-containing protein [Psychrobacter nivimaris]
MELNNITIWRTIMSLISRFEENPSAVINELLGQKLVGGNREIAEEIASNGNVVGFSSGEAIITQGDYDQDIYFILAGEVSMMINGAKLPYSRGPGNNIGEMSAINPSKPRSATLIASGEVITVKVNASFFNELMEKYPDVYKIISIDLANRLEQRNILIEESNKIPKLFIISTVEALDVARDIKVELDHDDIAVDIWCDQDVFEGGSYTLESLEKAVKTSDFGLAIMSSDDTVTSREEESRIPRDNVIFELGLFMGHLGRQRTLMALPRNNKPNLASDLKGITPLEYKVSNGKIDTGVLVTKLRKLIAKHGIR